MTQDDIFGGATPDDVTPADQIACVRREIEMREKVYPRWVEKGRMQPHEATRELLCMRAVLKTLETLYEETQR